jgi:hypothetical protein
MCNKSYNGYTNYETWNVGLWIDNEQGSYNYVYSLASECFEDAEEDRYNSKEENAIIKLAEQIKNYVEEMNPLTDDTSLFSGLLNAALGEVDWYDIAETWIKENV